MSGIGMTTLAQLSYNESDDMVMKTIAQRVIVSRKFENDNDLDFIQLRLKKALIKKKFLIVLDDVWVENYSLWKELMKLFSHGEYGSMSGIGMTTLAQLSYNESDDMVMKTIAQRVITSRKFENDNDLDCMSGIGMTTLAQLSCNESDDMVIKTIAQRVIISRKFENDNDLDFIQLRLKKALIKKKFLIVLDDVWVENYSLWNELMKLFSHVEYGSKIIVTKWKFLVS
ncbi:hypothetical protein FEM48_Zijuj05G0158200 [Ziziphus jujuba var. spinosa]|uniref:NB-ARC domain-containing protein n=1 Tax=Ziziphus jujuba var. spinosa TaxID=714518 RepID=A0A978VFQ2_ZIZJJ|nr:hypothetical protein FEM48_Zijuj05G0158200 [Ziziphus jujuba var. spinosa]